MASDRGCWFVQNPRSNRQNGVGYPLGLVAGARVALGTDGFASNMRDEARALAEASAEAGEADRVTAGRLDAGWALVEDRLGVARPAIEAAAGRVPSDAAIDEVDASARAEAARLWTRW
jgi:cytosine/adenosine deaminase-related metal-dependent hydrolase